MTTRPIRIAIDVMGGDYGVTVMLQGMLAAKRQWGKEFVPYLCGDRAKILEFLRESDLSEDEIAGEFAIEHCPDTLSSADAPSRVWKSRAQSSIIRCISLQRENKADASMSAGDTGILMGAAIFILGRLPHISRPALAALLPTTGAFPSLLLDVGANLNCRAEHLASFGLMGCDYFRKFFPVPCPTVALLNIGKEPRKGTSAIYEAAQILAKRYCGFSGFVEGSDVLSGAANVVACDGFVGNILLKACESFHSLVASVLKSSPDTAEIIRKKMAILNSENYGAVPLLGIKGIVLKAHGGSSPKAIAHALEATLALVRNTSAVLRQPARE
jgi:glycerol-3-phosphate acyltransferase PlsX